MDQAQEHNTPALYAPNVRLHLLQGCLGPGQREQGREGKGWGRRGRHGYGCLHVHPRPLLGIWGWSETLGVVPRVVLSLVLHSGDATGEELRRIF